MTRTRVILKSLRFYWASNLAVLAGVAVAVAVLVGSLVVGDSVKGSLRDLALGRIGGATVVIERPRTFRASLASDVLGSPALLLEGAARTPEADFSIPHVQVVGADDTFARIFPDSLATLSARDAFVNRRLAGELGIREGDALVVTLPRGGAAPIESIFGRKGRVDTLVTARVIVRRILPDGGVGLFSLRADRPRPRNLFVSRAWLAAQLGEPDTANTVFITGDQSNHFLDLGLQLHTLFSLEDFELSLTDSGPGRTTLVGRRIAVPPSVAATARELALKAGATAERRSVSLANSVRRADNDPGTPYSLIAGVEDLSGFESAGAALPAALGNNDILLDEWLAEDLRADVGANLWAEFYVAGPRGEIATVHRAFKVVGVVRMAGDALARDFVPEVRGMTDTRTMSDWDPPFPVDLKRIRQRDEDYWEKYRATPKAFVSLDAVRALWTHGLDPAVAERTPWITGIRIAGAPAFASDLRGALAPADGGFAVRDVRAEALAAANASTDFGVLFLSMSFFLVAAAAMLIFLLMRLTIDRRAAQVGLLLAEGFTPDAAARVLVGEALLVALAGVVVGVPLGIGYAGAVLWALKAGWSGAVADFPLALHVGRTSVAVGAFAGFLVAAIAIRLSARMLRKLPPLVLLSGWQAIAAELRGRRAPALVVGTLALALASALVLLSAAKMLAAGTGFAAAGALLLVAGLALLAAALGRPHRSGERISITRLALRSAARHRARSLLTAGLIACAALVIVTVAAFRRDPTREHPGPKDSGTGGFSLIVRTDLPVFADLDTPEGRKKIGFTDAQSADLTSARIYSLRESRGDDISCLNLQRSKSPRVVGVPDAFIQRGGFLFGAHDPLSADDSGNPWRLLIEPAGNVFPAFADADTAQWQMHVALGDNVTVPSPGGASARMRLAGLMPGSLFAGDLVVAETSFVRAFGSESGYRMFLVECPADDEPHAAHALRAALGDFGVDVQRTTEVLAAYASVQNTYLSAFQTLGGLGLALGTFGVVAVLLRSVIERRAELGMMLALGFTVGRVRALVLIENVLLLALGVAIGAAAALVASAPQLVSSAAGVRWGELALTVGGAAAVGLVSCALAAGFAVGRDVVVALRSE